MPRQIFVNLPVADLQRSIRFFSALGFTFNPQWTDETATCMIIGENIYVMLLTHQKFQPFTPKPIADANQTTEVLVCINQDSRADVDRMVALAVANGGSSYRAAEDHGFMYGHGFQDPDGHIWELVYLVPPA